MKRLLVLAIGLGAVAACDDTDNVGEQCSDVAVQCTSDLGCANYPGSVCGPAGYCLCDPESPDAAPPDAAPVCTPPPNPVTCGPGTPGCANYPGTVCDPATGMCSCPMAPTCTPPPPMTACQQDGASCSNYPGSVCGPNGYCVCP